MKRLLPSCLALTVAACGPGRTEGVCDVRPDLCSSGSSTFSAGSNCSTNSECGGGSCGDWPGGYCVKACQSTSQCGSAGICVEFTDGATCVERCTPGTKTCRAGYQCESLANKTDGFCRPSSGGGAGGGGGGVDIPVGASCSTSAQCGGGLCAGTPGGYCTNPCTNGSQCPANAYCVTEGINGITACALRCPTPGSQSTCRAGYRCGALVDKKDGFCAPDEGASGSPIGASCTGDSQCRSASCGTSWPGGYCTGKCTSSLQCDSGVCLEDLEAGTTYCVSQCATPGSRSSCREGYSCLPFAAPRTDGYCAPPANSGAGGGGGGTAPAVINYRVTGVQGTYSGDGVNIVSASRTDRLNRNTCSYNSTGTPGTQSAFIGVSGWTKVLGVTGTSACPAGTATSTAASSCTSQSTSSPNAPFDLTVELSGWTDSASVTFKLRYPPSGLPGCNYAAVILDAAAPWGMQASTTVGKFRAGVAFPVRFVGSKMLYAGSKTSEVGWDFTMTIQPN